jgi:hypothetical protein
VNPCIAHYFYPQETMNGKIQSASSLARHNRKTANAHLSKANTKTKPTQNKNF